MLLCVFVGAGGLAGSLPVHRGGGLLGILAVRYTGLVHLLAGVATLTDVCVVFDDLGHRLGHGLAIGLAMVFAADFIAGLLDVAVLVAAIAGAAMLAANAKAVRTTISFLMAKDLLSLLFHVTHKQPIVRICAVLPRVLSAWARYKKASAACG